MAKAKHHFENTLIYIAVTGTYGQYRTPHRSSVLNTWGATLPQLRRLGRDDRFNAMCCCILAFIFVTFIYVT